MRANKAGFALTLSLALALAACGGGGGGGGGDDDGGGNGGGSTPPPTGFGDFDGNFTLRGTNPATNNFATTFDDSFPAAFVDGRASVNGVATEFDYPLNAQGGCYYKRGAIDTCVEEAGGKVLALCSASTDREINSVGISDIRDASFNTATLDELIAAALATADDDLDLQSLNCAGDLDATDSVTVVAPEGTVIQRFGGTQAPLTRTIVNQLFSDAGRPVGSPENARVAAKAYKHTVGTDVTYYIVTFGAENAQGEALPPKVFVSVE